MADNVTTQVSDLPEWQKTFMKDLWGQGAALTDLGQNPYQQYSGDRFAQFTPFQQQAFKGASSMGVSPQFSTATKYATQAGQYNPFAGVADYQAGNFNFGDVSAPSLQNFQMQAPSDVYASQGPADVTSKGFSGPQMRAAQDTGRVDTFSSADAKQYMSPYQQAVTDIDLREAGRQADIRRLQQLNPARASAFGGTRDALLQAENERNLMQTMGDIQTRGSQQNYQQAREQYNADQARQQTMRLANLSNQQQAAVQNQASILQARGMSAQQALQAALANQQTGLSMNQQQLQARLANQQAGLTTAQQNLQAKLGVQQLGTETGLRAALANQAAAQAEQQAREQSRQFGYGQMMDEAQLREQSRQFGTNAQLNAAAQLNTLGQNQFSQKMDINKLLYGYGQDQQAQTQKILDARYQDFINQQRYPYQQLEFMRSLISGTPTGTVSQMYAPNPSLANQVTGAAVATSPYWMKAEGGLTDTRAGLADLAISKM